MSQPTAVLNSTAPAMGNLFQLDLQGRLRNFKLPAYRALVPLFEAVVNSLHAIAETGRSDGRITVEALRRPFDAPGTQQRLALPEKDKVLQPIVGFRVRDNGAGFTAENYESFCTSDSRKKLLIGGRGVGRFTWLKAFGTVSVDSTYRDGETLRRRAFAFTADRGITDDEDELCDARIPPETVVTLNEIQDPYGPIVPKKLATLRQHIVDHCFAAIRSLANPVLFELTDGEDSENISQEVEEMFENALTDELELHGSKFRLTHIRVASAEAASHKLIFMADGRDVKAESLTASIPQLKAKLEQDSRPFWWWTLVESDALNDAVSPERDRFIMPDEDVLPNIMSLAAIRAAVMPKIVARVEQLIAPIKEKTRAQVKRFVETKAPEYRHVVKMRPEAVDAIAPDLPQEKLDLELHRISYELEADVRANGARILRGDNVNQEDYERFLSDENLVGKANLAKYVVHRRIVLDLFRKALERQGDGKHSLEEAVHKLIFPLQKTSEEVPYEQLNLWMIDERLAYHRYLASDKKLNTLDVLESEAEQRPDLIIFNDAFAFSDHAAPFGSVVIVEFKRPARNDYTDDKNPVKQVYDYIRRVREGKAQDRSGRSMSIRADMPFYCYIVCDLTPKMREFAENASLRPTPEGEGFYGFNDTFQAYVEVVSFAKVLADSEKRNRMLFDKLNLPK